MIYLHCDGASKGNPGPASIGVSATRNLSDTDEVFSISREIGKKTNNEAEWISLLEGLSEAVSRNEMKIHIYMDSELVVKQVKGVYKTKKAELREIKKKVDQLIKFFEEFRISHVLREKNKRADELANLAFSNKPK
ncbi:MAG: ribonuclease HI family protein [Leptospira sp.]|nr:ribonuclease HI family protein [Leptospira sp.]